MTTFYNELFQGTAIEVIPTKGSISGLKMRVNQVSIFLATKLIIKYIYCTGRPRNIYFFKSFYNFYKPALIYFL